MYRYAILLSFFSAPVYANSVIPNFNQGVLTQRSETKSTVVEDIKSFDIKNATIKQNTNFFDSNTFSPTKGLIIAGDHSVYGSIEGAVLSGVNASKKILN